MARKLVTRRGFLAQSTVAAVGATAGSAVARLATADQEKTAAGGAAERKAGRHADRLSYRRVQLGQFQL